MFLDQKMGEDLSVGGSPHFGVFWGWGRMREDLKKNSLGKKYPEKNEELLS